MKTQTVMAEPLRVKVGEAARILGISRTRLYLHVKAGALHTVKDGGNTLILMDELRAFVARSHPGPSE